MNALDNILEGDEQIIHLITEDQGPLAADDFRHTFNNACLQLAGLEHWVVNLHLMTSSPIAPITNMSYMEH
jgi:hypothetical protein